MFNPKTLINILLNPQIMKNWSNDKWEFYKDRKGEWRWARTAPNGKKVGASTEGYKNKQDCIKNAKRNGCT